MSGETIPEQRKRKRKKRKKKGERIIIMIIKEAVGEGGRSRPIVHHWCGGGRKEGANRIDPIWFRCITSIGVDVNANLLVKHVMGRWVDILPVNLLPIIINLLLLLGLIVVIITTALLTTMLCVYLGHEPRIAPHRLRSSTTAGHQEAPDASAFLPESFPYFFSLSNQLFNNSIGHSSCHCCPGSCGSCGFNQNPEFHIWYLGNSWRFLLLLLLLVSFLFNMELAGVD